MTRISLLTKCLTFNKIATVFDGFKQSSFRINQMLCVGTCLIHACIINFNTK